MRRLLRWAFNGAAAVSAVLLIATCVISVRSYWAADFCEFPMGQRRVRHRFSRKDNVKLRVRNWSSYSTVRHGIIPS